MKNQVFILMVLLGLIFVNTASGWSNDPQLNTQVTYGTQENVIPKIEYSENAYYMTWFKSHQGSYVLCAQKFNILGEKQWGNEGIIVSNAPQQSWLTDYDMGAFPGGGFVVAFPDIRNGGLDIQVSRIDENGNALWGENGFSLTVSDGFNATPKLEIFPNGISVITWLEIDSSSVYVQALNEYGEKLWGDDGIVFYSGSYVSTKPDLVKCDDQSFFLQWSKETGPPHSPTRNLNLQRIDLSGNILWENDLAITTEGGISAWTDINVTNDNAQGIIISWHDDRHFTMISRAYVQAVDKDGNLRFPEGGLLLDNTSGYNSWNPVCSVDSQNNIHAVWVRNDAQYQTYTSIIVQKLEGADPVWGNNGTAVTEESNLVSSSPSSGIVNDKLFVAIGRYNFGNYMQTDLTAVLLNEDCENVWEEEAMLSSYPSTKYHFADTGWVNHMIVLAWQDERNSQTNIYMQNLNYNGTIGNQGPDAFITPFDITFQPQNPMPGDIVEITARVHNIGNEAIESGYIDFFYSLGPGTDLYLIDTISFGAIMPSEYITVSADWATGQDMDPTIYIITASIRDVFPDEINLFNNTAYIELPLPVELGHFYARGLGNRVIINWMTITQTDNLGFNLYRISGTKLWPHVSAYPVKLNESIIPGQGTSSSPEHYYFTDNVKNGKEYIYMLECISTCGVETDRYRTRLQWLF